MGREHMNKIDSKNQRNIMNMEILIKKLFRRRWITKIVKVKERKKIQKNKNNAKNSFFTMRTTKKLIILQINLFLNQD